MVTQSERATTAKESQFRVNYPNSEPRRSVVLALDEPGRGIVKDLHTMEWQGARFYSMKPKGEISGQTLVTLETPEGKQVELDNVLDEADVVVMVATSGTPTEHVAALGKRCFERSIMTNGFVLDYGTGTEELNQTLRAVRPWVISLVTGSDQDYLVEALRSIRA